jgi:hypothetical protein
LIIPLLHRQPVALDHQQHRQHKIVLPVADWSVASRLNGIFVAASEFSDIAKEYPIVFVRAGKAPDGRDEIAPIAVLGVVNEQNLYLQGAPGPAQWRASYKPAVLAAYPFGIARVDEQRFAICVDAAWPGFSTGEGQALFDAEGKPAEVLNAVQKHMELLESEIQATRAFGQRLLEHGLLRDMRFDATLPGGRQHTVEGFLTVDQEKAQTLPDNVVGELFRNGTLGLIHLHWASLGLMRRLLDWHVERNPQAAAPAAAGAAGAPSAPSAPSVPSAPAA